MYHIYIYIYTYICIEREREREREILYHMYLGQPEEVHGHVNHVAVQLHRLDMMNILIKH